MLARAERMEREVLAIAREVDRRDERPVGVVRVSVPEGVGLTIVAPRLAAFHREHPAIDLLLVAEAPVVDLSRREADLALRFVRPRQHELVVRKLASVPFAPYASEAYLAARPREPQVVLPADDVVALHEDMTGSPEVAWLRRHMPQARIRVRVRTPLGTLAAIAAGAGVGLLAPYLGANPGLRRLGGVPPLVRDMFLVHHRSVRRTARVQIVGRFLAECVRGALARPR
jgi:DNA-binding transcriptional LysR family regulator